jgi:hypothetical protein
VNTIAKFGWLGAINPPFKVIEAAIGTTCYYPVPCPCHLSIIAAVTIAGYDSHAGLRSVPIRIVE